MAGLVRNQLDNDVRPLNALVPDEINDVPGFINGPRPIGPSMRYPCMPHQYPPPVYAVPPLAPSPGPVGLPTLPPSMGTRKKKASEGGFSYVMHCERVVRGQEPIRCGDWLVLLMLALMVHFRQFWALALIFFFAALSHNGLL